MADPNINNVVFLAKFDGTDEDTAYTPEIGDALVFNGAAKIDSAQKKFGPTSLYLGGSGDYLTTGIAGDYNFLTDGTSDWTIEIFGYTPSTNGRSSYVLSTMIDTAGNWDGFYFDISTRPDCSVQLYGGGSPIAYLNSTYYGLPTDQFNYYKMTFEVGVGLKLYVNGTLEGTMAASGTSIIDTGVLHIGRFVEYPIDDAEGWFDSIRITKGEALSDTDVPTVDFPGGISQSAILAAPSPLVPALRGFVDFSDLITDLRSFYVVELTGDPVLPVPVKSWQATMQVNRAQYAQVVIPNVSAYIDELTARKDTEEFVIYRATVINGVTQRSELARAPISSVILDRGATNYTATVSGYADSYIPPETTKTRTLTEVRSINTGSTGKLRVRCAIDWFLRPGDTAVYGADTLQADYINYYATDGQAYMDVGDR